MLPFKSYASISENISWSLQAIKSELNIIKYSNSNIICKASFYYNTASSLSNINLNTNVYLDNMTDRNELTKLTDDFQATNLSKKTTSKKVSAFPFFGANTDCNIKIFTYLERAKFSLPFQCVNPVNKSNMSVKSMQIQCENTTKSKHVHHFGFVLVTSVYDRTSPRSPKQLYFNTRLYERLRIVVISKEPGSPMYSYRVNKYIQKVARLENKL